jgi:hypothetical protein
VKEKENRQKKKDGQRLRTEVEESATSNEAVSYRYEMS